MTITFPIEIQPNGKVKINNSSNSIKQFVQESLENVVGSFGFDRDFGSKIRTLDFTPNDPNYIEQRLFASIRASLEAISEITFQDTTLIEWGNGVIKYEVSYFYQNELETIEFVL